MAQVQNLSSSDPNQPGMERIYSCTHPIPRTIKLATFFVTGTVRKSFQSAEILNVAYLETHVSEFVGYEIGMRDWLSETFKSKLMPLMFTQRTLFLSTTTSFTESD
jgi:hypothetical protein